MAAPEPRTAAVRALATAEALIVTAGAGLGVDSGLPDFRGPEGFWRAYPAAAEEFLDEIRDRNTVVIELGAGTAVPTVRWTSEGLQRSGATLIRINPREPEGPRGTISLAGGAAAELAELAAALGASGREP